MKNILFRAFPWLHKRKQFWEGTKGFCIVLFEVPKSKALQLLSAHCYVCMPLPIPCYFRKDLIFAGIAANLHRPDRILQKMLIGFPLMLHRHLLLCFQELRHVWWTYGIRFQEYFANHAFQSGKLKVRPANPYLGYCLCWLVFKSTEIPLT